MRNAASSARSILIPCLLVLLAAPAAADAAAPAGPPRGDGKGSVRWIPTDSTGAPLRPRVGDARDAENDVVHYLLDLEIRADQQWIGGTNTITVRSLIDNMTTFQFRLDNILTITDVRIGSTSLSWVRLANPTVLVTLDRAYHAGEQFDLVVAYNGHPHSDGMGSIEFGFRPPGVWDFFTLSEPWFAYTWWPDKDDLRDKTTADLWFTVPSGMVVASNGTLQGVDPLPQNRSRYRWKTDYPTDDYLYCVGTTNYTEFGTTWDYQGRQMPLKFYIYPEDDTPFNRSAWLATTQMLTTYSDLFGLYPFVNEKYGMLEWNAMMGMEHQTMTSILGGIMGFTWETGIAHELSHQWWGDAITCGTWHDIWLNEGFADYCQALWAQYKPGSPGESALHQMMNYDLHPDTVDGTVYCYDLTDVNRIFDDNLTYRKGGWVLHMLRHVLGDPTFFGALHAYREGFEGGSALTSDFQSAVQTASGRDLDWFFQEWVYLPGAPAYQYAWRQTVVDARRYVELYLKQVQPPTDPTFTMPVDVQVNQTGGGVHVVWNDAPAEHLLFPVAAGSVASVTLDPSAWILTRSVTTTAFTEGPPKIVSTDPAPGDSLPAAGLTALRVVFHKAVLAHADDFRLVGRASGDVPFSFAYDPTHYAATLTLQGPLAIDAYTLTVSDHVTDLASGQALDGEMVRPDGIDTLPSGDGLPGGSADVTFVITAGPAAVASSPAPARTSLCGAWPNPSRGRTDVRFELARAGRARLSVLDPGGRLVRILLDADLPAGVRRCAWDGADASGHAAGPGVYFLRLEAAGVTNGAKLLLVR